MASSKRSFLTPGMPVTCRPQPIHAVKIGIRNQLCPLIWSSCLLKQLVELNKYGRPPNRDLKNCQILMHVPKPTRQLITIGQLCHWNWIGPMVFSHSKLNRNYGNSWVFIYLDSGIVSMKRLHVLSRHVRVRLLLVAPCGHWDIVVTWWKRVSIRSLGLPLHSRIIL